MRAFRPYLTMSVFSISQDSGRLVRGGALCDHPALPVLARRLDPALVVPFTASSSCRKCWAAQHGGGSVQDGTLTAVQQDGLETEGCPKEIPK